MEIKITLDEVRRLSGVSKESGNTEIGLISGIATLSEAKVGDLSFLTSAKFKGQLEGCLASVVIVPEDLDVLPGADQLFLYAKNPSLSIAKVCEVIAAKMWIRKPAGVHPSTYVSPEAIVDETASIGPNCVIESGVNIGANVQVSAGCVIDENVVIGEDSILSSNITLVRGTVVGKRVQIHPGVVLGSDGFGYEPTPQGIYKIPQIGNVIIGDDVEIGANTTIDRGRFGPTRVGMGSKIDNQVQIGHNVQIGNCCILCSQVGIAGSTTIEDFVVMGGRSGASGHIRIGKGAQIAGCGVAFTDLEAGGKYGGTPAVGLMTFHRITAVTQRLPEIFKRMKRLESLIPSE